jgi:hypothetical protein
MQNRIPILQWIGALTSLVTIVLLALVLVKSSRTEQKLESQIARLEEARVEQVRMQSQSEKIYQTVISALETRDSTRQEIARLLVTAMNDDPSRRQLLDLMNASDLTAGSVKKRIRHVITIENTFETEEAEVPQTAAGTIDNGKKWNYDIFFLEERRPDSLLAAAIRARMIRDGYGGRLRVRMLPASVNMRSGYQVAAPEIRCNTWEQREAEQVKQLLDGFPVAADLNFTLHTIAMNTPNYISVFVSR